MLRLTLMLGAAIYAGLVIFSERAPDAAAPGVDVTRAAGVDATAPAQPTPTGRLVTADGRVLAIATVIDPAALVTDRDTIHAVSTRAPETVIASASAGQPDLPLVQVTGASVNLRAGPSTDQPVLDALVQGERAELIAALGNGWVQIRTVDGGVEGYMADRFVAPVN
ncbi:SH3 domain-containing protein [Roseicyclus persicicus]|uniref:SH3 domain-containing protein n=1 Tax=Roseicyclus persicicus TaxID=2650661 RepID=A0A7X6GX45_9RHOB|nr:SH3 domain-containing protein [Roseibacterium persicicum]NKX43279.1 SH3 domain-containing protein [Roseibacterium persicicum]